MLLYFSFGGFGSRWLFDAYLEKANRELEELNEFLEEASAFFAASRRKSGKKND